MMFKTFFEDKFKREHSRLRRIIEFFEDQENKIPESVMKLMAHIMNAQHIWLCHLKSIPAESDFWDLPPLHFFHRLNNQNLTETLDYLEKEVLLNTIQTNPYEEEQQKRIMDVLHYMLEHAAYHRGQVALNLKIHNLQPPELQMMTFD